jgi:hypothetical protein
MCIQYIHTLSEKINILFVRSLETDRKTNLRRTSKLIAKFCGRDEVQVVSSGRYLFIEFVSDDSTQLAGFKLRYHFQQTIYTYIVGKN